MKDTTSAIPVGFCQCGCGKKTNPAPYTSERYGYVKGEPMPHFRGHGRWANTLAQRLWSRIDKFGPDECWPWNGAHTQAGYGVISKNGSMTTATRVVYELTHGPIPEGQIVCHTCDNPACCNPSHLWLGTDKDNSDDKIAKGRYNSPDNNGEHNPRAMLSETDVRNIREAHASGVTLRELSERYGVQKPAIWKIVTRRTWSHVS